MFQLKNYAICSVLSLGCLSFISSVPSALVGMMKTVQKAVTSKKPKWYPKYCYKWIIYFSNGELIVCPTIEGTPQKYFFYLWWLKEYDFKTNDGSKQYFYPVQSISTNVDSISFTFKGGANSSSSGKSLTINQWEKRSEKDKNIQKFNGVNLEDNCKVEGKKLSCLNNQYIANWLDYQPFYF